MSVPFLDLAAQQREVADGVEAALMRVARSGNFIMGPELERFEMAFSAFIGSTVCVGVGNGLDALRIGLASAGVGPGDEVIVPAHTYIATWLAVSEVGATPVPVEPLEDTYNIDPAAVEDAITARTRAIVPVHLYGQPADMKAINAIAQRHNLFVLQDAAQAHGARLYGDRVGQHGTAAWSFYPTKNLGAMGDGGALTSDDGKIGDRARLLRNYGSAEKYLHELKGLNTRLDPIQAAVLTEKLAFLDAWSDRRRAIAAKYIRELTPIGLNMPTVPDWAEPVWHLFVVRHPERDAFRARLQKAGIGTLIHYPTPPHLQPAYREMGFSAGVLPIAERLAREVISLPMCPTQTSAQTEEVIDAVIRLS